MAGVVQLQRQLVDYTALLFQEGFLNDQFTQLQQLQDESNPDFVVEVVSLFFEDSERLLNELAKTLDQQSIDFGKVDSHVHQLKGSSSRKFLDQGYNIRSWCESNGFSLRAQQRAHLIPIGAQRVQNACIVFRNCCDAQNTEGCLKCLQQVKLEYSLVKNKLETLFKLEQQILAAGGSIPM